MSRAEKRENGPGVWLGFVCAVLALTVTAPAMAQSADIDRVPGSGFQMGPGRMEGIRVTRPGALLFASFDRNFDGRITAEEIDIGIAGAFASADRNGDGLLTGFEQSDWATAIGAASDVLSNPMTFDTDLDRSITPVEFAAGIRRLADSLARTPGGDIAFSDLLQPLSGPGSAQAGRGPASGRGTGSPLSAQDR